jgi:putative acetyltransferase
MRFRAAGGEVVDHDLAMTSPSAGPTGLVIRPERPDDHPAIAAVVDAAFESTTESALVERIRATPQSRPELALVAELDGEVVGHVMISGAALVDDHTEHAVVTLSPLAVHPDRQAQGIGGALVREVVRLADAAGEPLVLLEGDPRYYSRFGFEDARSHGIRFTLPEWAPPEAGQVWRLAAYDPSLRGEVRYSSAFDEVLEHPDGPPADSTG